MGNNLAKERFIGGFNNSVPKTLLPPGVIAGGGNVRVAGATGGWKGRRGCTLKNTTAEASAVTEVFPYFASYLPESNMIAHVGSYFHETAQGTGALGQAAAVGTALSSLNVGTPLGYGCQIGEEFFYANGEGKPVVYSGDLVKCRGLLLYGAADVVTTDYTLQVTDDTNSSYIEVTMNSDKTLYVCGKERLDEVYFALSTSLNNNTATIAVAAWRSAAWTAVSGTADGTAVAGATLAQAGSITWTASGLDEMKVMGGVMGYWYRITASTTLDAVRCTGCWVGSPISRLTSKWDGVFQYPAGAVHYDVSATSYIDFYSKITNTSQSTYYQIGAMSHTNDFLYIKSNAPLAGVGIGFVEGKVNADAATLSKVETWIGSGWGALTGVVDGTSNGTLTFAQTGQIFWDFNSQSPLKRALGADNLPGYWYRLSTAASALSADVQIYTIVVAEAPESLYNYTGCEEFRGRLVLWGDPIYPNRLRYSPEGRPDYIGAEITSYTSPLGDAKVILIAKNFQNYLFAGKSSGMFLLDENFNVQRVSSKVGIVSGQTLQMVEVGTKGMQQDETVNVAIWLDGDGVYQYDLRAVKKISLPIGRYFDPSHSSYLTAASISAATSFCDAEKNEYHLLIGTTELVYNYQSEVWYPPWSRALPITNGNGFKWYDGRYYTLGVTVTGFVLQLENAISDKNASNQAVGIAQSIVTRVLSPSEQGMMLSFNLRKLWLVGENGTTTATITAGVYKNGDGSITTLSTDLLYTSGYTVAVGIWDNSIPDLAFMEVSFACGLATYLMEIHEMFYEYELKGLISL